MDRFALRGISLLEFALVVAAIAVISGLLLARVLPLIAQSERVAFQRTTRLLQNALLLEAAERIARGESATLSALAGSNPMQLLLEPPGNYRGVLDEADDRAARGRSWYFDEAMGELVYLPGALAGIDAAEEPPEDIRMHVSFVFTDRDSDGSFDASVDHFDGLRFESVKDYSWPKQDK